jgi:glycosyltransferase involved in cell wall biosynthesis
VPQAEPRPELSVVVLCYRAEAHARRVVIPLYGELEREGLPYELILVANYWSPDDRTPAIVEQLADGRDTIRVVAEPKQGDMGWDMRAGLREARGKYLVVIDGDGQVPLQYAAEAYRVLKQSGAAIAKGRRFVREDGTVRSITSLGYNLLFRLLFGTQGLWDINGRPKALTRTAYERLALTTDDWFTDAEMVLKAKREGLPIAEFSVRFLRNEARGSFVGLDTVWEFLRNMASWRLGRHPAQRAVEPIPEEVARPDREKTLV